MTEVFNKLNMNMNTKFDEIKDQIAKKVKHEEGSISMFDFGERKPVKNLF